MLTLEQAKQRVFDRCNLQLGDIDIYKEMYRYKAITSLSDHDFENVYDEISERLGFYSFNRR